MAALRKSDPLRLMRRRLLIGFLALLALAAAWGVWDMWGKYAESARLRGESQAKLASLEAQVAKLQADYGKLSTDRGMEEALRDQYNVGKSGEGAIMIVEPRGEPAAAPPSPWQWVRKMFFWW